jgi:hypothetical protein
MIDNLLDSYTMRELKALANRLGVEPYVGSHSSGIRAVSSSLYLADAISDILFDPGGSYHDFNKLAEMEA